MEHIAQVNMTISVHRRYWLSINFSSNVDRHACNSARFFFGGGRGGGVGVIQAWHFPMESAVSFFRVLCKPTFKRNYLTIQQSMFPTPVALSQFQIGPCQHLQFRNIYQ